MFRVTWAPVDQVLEVVVLRRIGEHLLLRLALILVQQRIRHHFE